MNTIPKIIWMYWDQGWDKAPELVQQCKKSWQHHNPNWEIRALDRKSVVDYFDIEQWMPGEDLKPKWLTPIKKKLHQLLHNSELLKTKTIKLPQRSDIVRINLLKQYGGVWADATLFCRKPLDEWIEPHIKEGFFCFSNPGSNLTLKDGSLPIFLSYFLISSKNNYIIEELTAKTYQYCQNNREISRYYLFIFDLFNQCYNNDNKFAKIWDKVAKIDAPIPNKGEFDNTGGVEFFAWQTVEQLNDLSQEYKKMLATSPTPCFKLSHKDIYSPKNATRINYLFKL